MSVLCEAVKIPFVMQNFYFTFILLQRDLILRLRMQSRIRHICVQIMPLLYPPYLPYLWRAKQIISPAKHPIDSSTVNWGDMEVIS